MSDEYTPTDAEARAWFTRGVDEAYSLTADPAIADGNALFDRWLEAHDRRLIAKTVAAAYIFTDTLIGTINAIRDQGAPEDVLEHLTDTLAGLNQARRALDGASRSLCHHSEEPL